MTDGIPTSRLVVESAPAAIVLLFWTLVASLFPEPVAGSVRFAGVVMATLYVVVRGVHLAGTIELAELPTVPGELLSENLHVAAAAGVWFVAGILLPGLRPLAHLVSLEMAADVAARFVDPLAFVFGTTGVATVGLYATAAGLQRVRDVPPGTQREGDRAADVAPGDD